MLIGYYIPLSTMIAPVFDEVPGQDEDEDEEEDNGDAKDGSQAKKRCFCCKAKPIEAEEEKEETDLKKFVSMKNYVDFVNQFVSMVTVTKCWMLILATFLFKGGVYDTIVCDLLACLALLVFTLKWTFDNLQQYGLTQNIIDSKLLLFAAIFVSSLGVLFLLCKDLTTQLHNLHK